MRARPIVFKMAIGPSKSSSSASPGLAPRVQALLACTAFFIVASLYAIARSNLSDLPHGMTAFSRAHLTATPGHRNESRETDQRGTGPHGDMWDDASTTDACPGHSKASNAAEDYAHGQSTARTFHSVHYDRDELWERVTGDQGRPGYSDAFAWAFQTAKKTAGGQNFVIVISLAVRLFELNELNLGALCFALPQLCTILFTARWLLVTISFFDGFVFSIVPATALHSRLGSALGSVC